MDVRFGRGDQGAETDNVLVRSELGIGRNEERHLFVRHLDSRGIRFGIKLALNSKSLSCRRRSDEVYNDLMTHQGLSPPILADE